MGQKVHPYSFRLGINKTWKSCWYVEPKKYGDTLHEDLLLRKSLLNYPETKGADVFDIEIIRQPGKVVLVVHTARPGVFIGVKGANVEKINSSLQKLTQYNLKVRVKEMRRPELESQVIALNIARQLRLRSPFRRVLKQAVYQTMKAGALGIKIRISGRLGGAEMSRHFELKEGRVPLHTLRADIDYGFAESMTSFGVIGVKVWVFKNEVLKVDQKDDMGIIVAKKVES